MTLRTEVIETGLNFNTAKYSVMHLRAAMKYRQLRLYRKRMTIIGYPRHPFDTALKKTTQII